MQMENEVVCSNCGQRVVVPRTSGGRRMICPICGGNLPVSPTESERSDSGDAEITRVLDEGDDLAEMTAPLADDDFDDEGVMDAIPVGTHPPPAQQPLPTSDADAADDEPILDAIPVGDPPAEQQANRPAKPSQDASIVRVVCPGCRHEYRVSPSLLGKAMKCGSCGKRFAISAPSRNAVAPTTPRRKEATGEPAEDERRGKMSEVDKERARYQLESLLSQADKEVDSAGNLPMGVCGLSLLVLFVLTWGFKGLWWAIGVTLVVGVIGLVRAVVWWESRGKQLVDAKYRKPIETAAYQAGLSYDEVTKIIQENHSNLKDVW